MRKRFLTYLLFVLIGTVWVAHAGIVGPVGIGATKDDTLFVDIDSDNAADPGDTLRYTVTIMNSGTSDATDVMFDDTIDGNTTLVAGSLRTTPIARHDSYASIGNVGITVPAGSGVLVNDNDPDGTTPTLNLFGFDATSANGGAVAVAGDGGFTYDPPAGFEGTDSFGYTIQDADGNTDPATVFITVSDVVWFIDNAAASGGDGRLNTPFSSISAFNSAAVDDPGDIVFIYSGSGNYTSGISLQNNQMLIGQGATASIESIAGISLPSFSNTLPTTGGARPHITSPSGDGVLLAQSNLLRGFNVGNTAGVGFSDNGGTVGTLTVSEVAISGTGGGIEVDNGGTLAVTLDSLSATSSSDEGIDLESVTGSFAVTGTTGTLSMTGVPAIVVDGNPSVALSLTFESVSANGGARGIAIRKTTGSFTIAGSGTADGSGGTIQNITARGFEAINAQNIALSNMNFTNAATTNGVAPGSPTCDTAEPSGLTNTGCNAPIYLESATGVNLTNLTINGSAQNGINGNGVTNFTLTNSELSNIGNEALENGIQFLNLLGNNTFNNVTIDGSQTRNALIENVQGSSTINLTSSTINNAVGEDGFFVKGASRGGMNAVVTLNVSDCSFTHNQAVQLKAHAEEGSSLVVNITGNAFDGEPLVVGNVGIDLVARDNAILTFDVLGTGGDPQTFAPFRSHAVTVFIFGGASGSGTVDGNTIDGSEVGAGVRAIAEVTTSGNPSLVIDVSNNVISNIKGAGLAGIDIRSRQGVVAATGAADVQATVDNNSVGVTSTADANIQFYINSGNSLCAAVTNNAASGTPAFGDAFYVGNPVLGDSLGAGTAQLFGWTGNIDTTWNNNGNTPGDSAFLDGTISGTCTPDLPLASVAAGFDVVVADNGAWAMVRDLPLAEEELASDKPRAAFDHGGLAESPADAPIKQTVGADGESRSGAAASPLLSGETVNVSLGTLNAGQAVTITFDVTIDNPLAPSTTTEVCNQGTVSGGNFANVLTDDSDTGTADDPTCTALDEGKVVVNEIDYDQPAADVGEFIELLNTGPLAADLSAFAIELVNGSGGGALVYQTIALPSVTLAANDYFVVCGDAANVPNCDLDVTPDSNLIQNGAPDAVALLKNSVLVDTVSYEGDTGAPYTEGSGVGLEDNPTLSNWGLSRCPDGTDTDQNSVDIILRPVTPGVSNNCDVVPFGACGDSATFIHDIQGPGASSPLAGSIEIIIEGVVVGDFQNQTAELGGFFLQEEDSDADADPLTSEGIFVFDNGFGTSVSVGDVVRVQGEVAEFFGETQLTNILNMAVCSSGNSATPAAVTLPLADLTEWERYEGMLVNIPQTLVATGHHNLGRFGEVELSVDTRLFKPTNVVAPGSAANTLQDLNDRSRIQLDDGSRFSDPTPLPPYLGPDNTLRLGDSIPSLTGVLSFTFGDYEVHPTSSVSFTRVNARTATPPAVGGSLTVASFNVLNYFTTVNCGSPNCIGADNATELIRQRDKLVAALQAVDADIVGLVEIENNATAAIQDLVNGLNAVVGTGTYGFVDTGIIGSQFVKNALIYKPGTVTPVGSFAVLDSSVDSRFFDDKNRPSLAQSFEQNSNGQIVTIAVNHFKSKGSPCDDVGDPDMGDGQENCNVTRTAAAMALSDWLATDPTGSGSPHFLIVGDLNSYAMEDPISTLTTAGYTDLIASFVGSDAYSFVFDGQAGYLDYALANASLTSRVTGATEWHINADEPRALDYEDSNQPGLYNPDQYRSSDHDPIIVGLELNAAPMVNVTPLTQTVQYSDYIADVIISATDADSTSLSISHDPLPSALSLTDNGCTPDGSGGTSCSWRLSGQVLVAESTHPITFTVSDSVVDTEAETEIVVEPEDAAVAFDGTNPVAVPVTSPGSDSSVPFSLLVHVREKSESGADVAPGDINMAEVSMTLEPVGPGSPATISCVSKGPVTPFDYDAVLIVSCDFSGLPVNTYSAMVTVDLAGYYAGSGEDVLVVYDPSLGFTTGGCTFIWPDTADPATGYGGDRTNAGYNMKYNKKGTRVQGSLALVRHLQDGSIYRLKSNALFGLSIGEGTNNGPFGWASFSGKATYIEPGWPQPEGNYEFVTYVEDHGEPGAGLDRFWIEVHDRDGLVVPLSSMDRPATDNNNNVLISGGNIFVPHTNQRKDRDEPQQLSPTGRGVRLLPNGTTDVWALGDYAYIGTFESPCGDGTGANGSGVRIFDVSDPASPTEVAVIPSPVGSRANDVKVARMNSTDLLVHSNEVCAAGGPGGFEVWDVVDPLNPVHLAHVQTDDVSEFLRDNFGFVDFGVHNLFLFSHGSNDYVAATVESLFGNFQLFDISDPTNPTLVGFWGAERLLFPSVDFATTTDFSGVILPADDYLMDGFGASRNRFLHDITVSADGTKAYLSNWDAGLVLLDISDPANPSLMSVALDPTAGSADGEVNSHAAWPSEDGRVVVETEEDFSAWETSGLQQFSFEEHPTNVIPGTAISTVAGDDFEANQTGNTGTVDASSVVVTSGALAGQTYPALEFNGNQPKFASVGSVSGNLVWIGRACPGDPLANPLNSGDIAVVRRGACFFYEKLDVAASSGASAIVIANNVPGPSTPWGGVRIWDYADPANPVLASTFETECSASTEPGGDCDVRGTYSVHNVIVEQQKAYISWYSEGVLILDISDPYNPVEVGRYHGEGAEFEAQNGGIQNVWGIYKVPGESLLYASDRNGGLYILDFGPRRGRGRR